MLWFRKAANQGNADAQYEIGNRYYRGEGVVQDYKEAMKWWRKAVDQGSVDAQVCIARGYYLGQGVVQDHKEAITWFRKAADEGNSLAEGFFGIMYSEGQGVSKNLEQSYFWLLIATANTDVDDYEVFVRVRDYAASKLTASQRNKIQKQASEWMRQKGFE